MLFPSRHDARQTIRVTLAGAALLLLAACGKETATEPSAAPAAIAIEAGNNQTGVVGAPLAKVLSVIVTDRTGGPITNAIVSWDVSSGAGSTSSMQSRTDTRGRAQVTWTLGTNAGTVRVTAQVGGVNPATFTATAQPGTIAVVVALPDVLALGLGDTVTVRATARDQYGNEIIGTGIVFSAPDPGVTVSAAGLVTATSIGSGRVVIASPTKSDTVNVTVSAAGSSVCGTTAITQMVVGQVVTPSVSGTSARLCLAGGTSNAEYGFVSFSSSTVFASTTAYDLYGLGLVSPTAPILAGANALPSVPSFDLGLGAMDVSNSALQFDREAERARHEMERKELAPYVDMAREAYTARKTTTSDFGFTAALRAVPNVGDTLRLNTQALTGCSNGTIKGAVVKAVGTRSIVVADTSNPANGYSLAEYQSIAATFDTLIYPLDVDNFGPPSDISGYGRVILFFTSAVNQLTPSGASFIIGGFFFSRDLYPKTSKNGLQGCTGSNEAEMFYLLVPDPTGIINNNRRLTTDVTRLNLTTIVHEFQHLINGSRRLYITPNAATAETPWLDEGLAHTAEELLYFKISGFGTRDNLNLTAVTSAVQGTNFSSYMAQNFGRFYERLRSPEITSPYATDDSLSTRGAIWNFLRYAAGRQPAGTEQAFFRSIVNSPNTGITNLSNALPGGLLQSYLADWSVAVMTDDYALLPQDQLDVRFKFPSWNFRSIYPNLRIGGSNPLGVYPLSVRTLNNNAVQRVSLAGGGASYARFAVSAGKTGAISLSTNGAAPATGLKFSVVRLR